MILATLKNNWPLFFGTLLLMIGSGLQGTLLGIRGESEGFGTQIIGLLMSAYYVGFLGGYFFAPKMITAVGHIRVFAALASLASTAVLLHGIFLEPALWFAGRLVSGFAYAGLYIVIESWLNQAANNKNRGSILAIYLIVSYGGIGLGQFLLNISDPNEIELFILTSILVSIALMPISLSKKQAPVLDTPEPISISKLYKASPLGIAGMFFNGIVSAIIFGLGAVYGSLAGFSIYEISLFMAAFLLGGIILPVPIGWLSDRISRRPVILLVSLFNVLIAGIVFYLSDLPFLTLLLAMTVFGGLNFSIYGLSIALTNDRLKASQMLSASSSLILINGLGACLGPVMGSFIMENTSPQSFFMMMSGIYSILLCFGLYRSLISRAVPIKEQGEFVAVPARGTPVAMQIAEDDASETEGKQR